MSVTDLRISFVTGTLQLGGSTTFLCNLAGELIRRHVTCRVFSDDSLHPLAKDFERLGIPVSLQNSRRNIFEDRIAGLLAELRDYEPTVVVATLAPFAFEILRYIPPGPLRIAMVQSDDPLVYQTIEKYTAFIDIVVGVSRTILQRLESMKSFQRVTKCYLPYGVPVPAEPVRTSPTGKPLRILYLGRVINEQKRVNVFPRIAANLENANIPFRWTIAGDGPDLDSLRSQMKSESRVEFVGVLGYNEVDGVLSAHDIFILTSDYEGLPLSLLEAMAHGLVPVASDLESGVRELVNSRNGMLVSPNDIDGYATAIIYLSAHRDDLAAKSMAARQSVEDQFSVKAMADRWLDALRPVSNAPVVWSTDWKIRAPLVDPTNIRYRAPVRFLRRRLLPLYRSFIDAQGK